MGPSSTVHMKARSLLGLIKASIKRNLNECHTDMHHGNITLQSWHHTRAGPAAAGKARILNP
ncbi:hypothetical protein MTR_3g069660 [Medicago truncatula]|uniref:Uncharacterized protein n=1 Tax=Medicago truncatula TaxID=3880 RepID=G7JAJ9_MEDTR|nr:hypothetical protein MTR_3g069660 [Medicago truncatula]